MEHQHINIIHDSVSPSASSAFVYMYLSLRREVVSFSNRLVVVWSSADLFNVLASGLFSRNQNYAISMNSADQEGEGIRFLLRLFPCYHFASSIPPARTFLLSQKLNSIQILDKKGRGNKHYLFYWRVYIAPQFSVQVGSSSQLNEKNDVTNQPSKPVNGVRYTLHIIHKKLSAV